MMAGVKPGIGDHLATPPQNPGLRHLRHQRGGQRLADTNDAEQQVASAAQFGVLVDRLADGPVDRLELASEMFDRRGGQLVAVLSPKPLPMQFFHSARLRMMPARIVCSSHSRRIGGDGGVHGSGLNNSAYSRIKAASTLSVLLRPSLVRAKSWICAGLTTLTTWPESCSASATPRL